MMISPEAYIDELKNAEYLQLIEERNRLVTYIREYEEKDIKGDRSGEEWSISPGPDVRYQVYLQYLSKLCGFMYEKYNQEYVWGDRKLSDDMEDRLTTHN